MKATAPRSAAASRDLAKIITHLDKAISAVTGRMDLREILYTVLMGVRDGLEFDRAGVFLVDEGAGVIRGEIGTDPKGDLEEIHSQLFSMDPKDNNFAKIAAGKIPHFFTENATDELPSSQTRFMTVTIKQNAIVPMAIDHRVIGMIAVDNLISKRPIEDTDLSLLKIFASHAALAIEHSRLYSGEERLIERLKEVGDMKSQFIAATAHELKSPLATIHEAAATMKMDLDSGMLKAKYPNFLDMITRQSDYLLRLITDLLDLSTIEAGVLRMNRQKMGVRKLIDDVVSELSNFLAAKSVKLKVEVPQDFEANVDPDHLRRVFRNLIQNAIRAVSDGGRIEVRGGRMDGAIRIVVSDDGQGIPLKDLERIFHRFVKGEHETTSAGTKSTGLGLPLARSLVEAHGGHLFAESEGLGKGARFVVTIPVSA